MNLHRCIKAGLLAAAASMAISPAWAQTDVNRHALPQVPARNPETAIQESGALLEGMVEIAEQVFDAPVRLGYPERDRFGGLVEDIQSPGWAAAAGLALVSQRAQTLELRAGAVKRGTTGKLTHFVSKFRNRFSSII